MTKEITKAVPLAVRDCAKWLRENLVLADGERRFSRVTCRHLVKGNKRGEDVFFLDVPKKANDSWANNTAMEIQSKLQAECVTLGGLQKWALYAYFSDDNDRHISRHLIKLQGHDEEEGDDDPLDSEGPDKTGMVSQAMRHAEA